MTLSNSHDVLFSGLRNDSLCYQNMLCIIDKLNADNTLDQITTLIQRVIDNEIQFTIGGNFTRIAQNTTAKPPHRHSNSPAQQQLRLQEELQVDCEESQFANKLTASGNNAQKVVCLRKQ